MRKGVWQSDALSVFMIEKLYIKLYITYSKSNNSKNFCQLSNLFIDFPTNKYNTSMKPIKKISVVSWGFVHCSIGIHYWYWICSAWSHWRLQPHRNVHDRLSLAHMQFPLHSPLLHSDAWSWYIFRKMSAAVVYTRMGDVLQCLLIAHTNDQQIHGWMVGGY